MMIIYTSSITNSILLISMGVCCNFEEYSIITSLIMFLNIEYPFVERPRFKVPRLHLLCPSSIEPLACSTPIKVL